MNYRNLINNLPYASETSQYKAGFFRSNNIRRVTRSSWEMMWRTHVGSNVEAPFQFIEGDFFLIPMHEDSTYKVDRLAALTLDGRFFYEGRNPFPLGMHTVYDASTVLIAASWEAYVKYFNSCTNGHLPFGIGCILIDVYTILNRQQEWPKKLANKKVALLPDEYEARLETLEQQLIHLAGLKVPRMTVEKKVKDTYLPRKDLVKYLKEKNVPATIDTVEKLARMFEVPRKKQGSKEVLSSVFYEIYYKEKAAGQTRKKAFESAMSKYKELIA